MSNFLKLTATNCEMSVHLFKICLSKDVDLAIDLTMIFGFVSFTNKGFVARKYFNTVFVSCPFVSCPFVSCPSCPSLGVQFYVRFTAHLGCEGTVRGG